MNFKRASLIIQSIGLIALTWKPGLPLATETVPPAPNSTHNQTEWYMAGGLFEMLPDGGPNAASWMKHYQLTLGGWVDAGLTYNPSNPGDGFNGTVTFGDRDRELQLNQTYLFLERAIDAESDNWDLGGRVDFLYGTDAVFSQANGNPSGHWDKHLLGNHNRFYQLAIPQVYMEVKTPVGSGLRTKIGHFYTTIGNESVMAPDNFFYSHTYLMQYGEPFTQTGLLTSYSFMDNLIFNVGAVTGSLTGGWDGVFDKNLNQWGFLGGVTWADETTSLTANANHGTQASNSGDWNIYSLVLHHDIIDSLHFTLQHDYGWADKAVNNHSAQWYGVVPYLVYDIEEKLSLGLRAEWFRDNQGFRVLSRTRISNYPAAGGSGHLSPLPSLGPQGNLTGNTYYEVTLGLNWKPQSWITVRPNVRYDWADNNRMFDCASNNLPSACQSNNQWLMSTDVILTF